LEKINLYDVLQHIRSDGDAFHTSENIRENSPEIERLFDIMDITAEEAFKQNNFLQLVTESKDKS